MISFVIIQLPPGDFVDTYIAKLESQNTNVSQEEAALMRAQYGLDDPGVVQYFKWVGQVLQGNYGQSLDYGEPVSNSSRDFGARESRPSLRSERFLSMAFS